MENWNTVLHGTAEKLPSRFCIACTLTVPKEGKPPIRMANFSEQTMLLRPGQTVAQFYPLDHIDASINLWKLEETCTENKAKQDTGVETPFLSGNEGFVLSSQRWRDDLLMAS